MIQASEFNKWGAKTPIECSDRLLGKFEEAARRYATNGQDVFARGDKLNEEQHLVSMGDNNGNILEPHQECDEGDA